MAHEKVGKAFMTVLIDTNVALDYLLHRQDYDNAMDIFDLAEKQIITGFISASAITDIFFLAKSYLGKKPTKEALKALLQVFCPATVTDDNIYEALNIDWEDFEDSVQFVVGKSFSADYIVTRNVKDYASGTISVLTPEQFLQLFPDDEEEDEKTAQ
jgi:predicted nucleic acid-binding protein